MANTLTGLIPTMYNALDRVSRELIGFIPAVTGDMTFARAAVGQTVISPVAPAATGTDIAPGVTPPNDGDKTIGSVSMTISKAKRSPVRWNGEEKLGLDNNGASYNTILSDQFTQSMRWLTNQVEADLAALYASASRASGTAGTTPFGTAGDLSGTADSLRILEENGAQGLDFQLVVGSAAMNNLRAKQSVLFKVNEAGSSDMLRTGMTNELQNFKLRQSAQIQTPAAGTGAGYLVNNAAAAVGDTTIPVDTGTGTILAGDVITIAGDSNQYVVATALTGGNVVIAKPGLKVAVADNSAVTVKGAAVRNMFFARSAIALATRVPALPQGGDMADDRTIITDPISGLSFEVALYRQYRQIQFEVALAWGTKAVKAEHMGLLLG